MNTFMPNLINNGINGFRGDNEERGFVLPFLAGLAITAPFWAGGFYGRRCCPPYPYPYPYPQPYPVPYPYPAGGYYGYGTLANRYLYPSPYSYYNRVPYTIY